MTVLCDANVLSEVTKPSPDPRVVAWLRASEAALAVDPIVLGELRFGIMRLPKGKRRDRLEAWFDAGARRMKCIPWDARTGLRWAELLAELRRKGRAMSVKDSMIAATALANDLPLSTLDARDFAAAGVTLVDPRHTAP